MAFKAFSENQVFTDNMINVTCNRIVTIVDSYKGEEVSDFAFSGDASKIYQGVSGAQSIGAISFKTASMSLYKIALKYFPLELNNVSYFEAYRTRILFKVYGYRFEVLFAQAPFDTLDENGILCQDYTPVVLP